MDGPKISRDHATAAEEANTKRKPPPWSVVLYMFVVLPAREVQFACLLLLKGPSSRQLQRKTLHSARHTGTSAQGSVRQWKLRRGVNGFLLGVVYFARLCFIPLWLCILCIEFLLGLMAYGLLFCLLQHNPLDPVLKDIRGSTLLSLTTKVA
jgi:hypothetical protein